MYDHGNGEYLTLFLIYDHSDDDGPMTMLILAIPVGLLFIYDRDNDDAPYELLLVSI